MRSICVCDAPRCATELDEHGSMATTSMAAGQTLEMRVRWMRTTSVVLRVQVDRNKLQPGLFNACHANVVTQNLHPTIAACALPSKHCLPVDFACHLLLLQTMQC